MRYFRDESVDYPSWQLLDNGDLQFRLTKSCEWEPAGLSLDYLERASDVEECDVNGRPLVKSEVIRSMPQSTYTRILELMHIATCVIERHREGKLGPAGDSVAIDNLENAVAELEEKLSE